MKLPISNTMTLDHVVHFLGYRLGKVDDVKGLFWERVSEGGCNEADYTFAEMQRKINISRTDLPDLLKGLL